MSYTPNFNDPRVIKRCKKALAFVTTRCSYTKDKQLSRVLLDKMFGKQGNQLTDYIRKTLLINTNNHYQFGINEVTKMSVSKCKEYIINEEGVRELTEIMFGSIVCDKTSENNHQLINDSPTITAYCATSFGQHQNAIDYLENEFKTELETFNFEYKDKANRLWNPFQNIKKEYKRTILARHGAIYEYDIEACAPTLLSQYAKVCNVRHLKTIDNYLRNKTKIRQELAENAEISVENAKQIITALFSGAQLHRSIKSIANNDHAKIEYLKQNEFIVALKKDISQMWKAIKEDRGIPNNKRLTSKMKWAIYFSLERDVLNVIMNYQDTKDNRSVLEHDGWTCKKQIDINELENEVYRLTGYILKISELVISDADIIPCFG